LRAEHVGEREPEAFGVVHHLAECVDALHLRGEQVVARAAVDAGVPGDAELGAQRERRLADLSEQREGRVLARQAEVVRRAAARAGLLDVRGGLLRLGWQSGGEALPGRDLGALGVGVGRHLL
jgi:hypothetical protein